MSLRQAVFYLATYLPACLGHAYKSKKDSYNRPKQYKLFYSFEKKQIRCKKNSLHPVCMSNWQNLFHEDFLFHALLYFFQKIYFFSEVFSIAILLLSLKHIHNKFERSPYFTLFSIFPQFLHKNFKIELSRIILMKCSFFDNFPFN